MATRGSFDSMSYLACSGRARRRRCRVGGLGARGRRRRRSPRRGGRSRESTPPRAPRSRAAATPGPGRTASWEPAPARRIRPAAPGGRPRRRRRGCRRGMRTGSRSRGAAAAGVGGWTPPWGPPPLLGVSSARGMEGMWWRRCDGLRPARDSARRWARCHSLAPRANRFFFLLLFFCSFHFFVNFVGSRLGLSLGLGQEPTIELSSFPQAFRALGRAEEGALYREPIGPFLLASRERVPDGGAARWWPGI